MSMCPRGVAIRKVPAPRDASHMLATTLPATLTLGAVDLTVKDLDRAVAWYQRSLGLRVHSHEATTAALGDGTVTVTTVILHEDPLAQPAGRHAGLYHFALLY